MSTKSLPYYDLNKITSDEALIFIKTAEDTDFISRAGYYWGMAKHFSLREAYYQKALALVVETNYSINRVYELFGHSYTQLEKFPSEVYFPTHQKLCLDKDKRFKRFFEKNFPQVSMIDII